MDVDPGSRLGRGGIRIGDAERERAAEALGEHLRAGRLNVGEYDERLTEAFAARTADDLTPLFLDLPGGSPLAPPAPEARWAAGSGGSGNRGDRPWAAQRRGFGLVSLPLRLLLVLAVIAVAVVGAVFATFPLLLIPLLWFGLGHRRYRRWGHGPRRHYY